MPTIHLQTKIKAPIQICFDLSRSIDLHKISVTGSKEEAIAGVTSGLIGLGETVTWRGTHFGIRQTLTSKIMGFHSPVYFRDEMIQGAFKKLGHDHIFEEQNGVTIMKDIFEFESPGWIIGDLVNYILLTKYLRKVLIERNAIIKDYAETDKWKSILK
jgi:ligand-binding SRPBCC domain-containing protein